LHTTFTYSGIKTPGAGEIQAYIGTHDEDSVRLYDHRFAQRVRVVTKRLHEYGSIPTDIVFQHVASGPKNLDDVFQIAAGLERLARQLYEPSELTQGAKHE
jgi:hypothetical protein